MCQPARHRGVCPYCHCTQEEAIQTGLVGCPLCYEMLDTTALTHFGVQKGALMPEKPWTLTVPTVPPVTEPNLIPRK